MNKKRVVLWTGLLILVCAVVAYTVHAGGILMMSGGVTAAGGVPYFVYSGPGSTPSGGAAQNGETNDAFGDAVTATADGNITKIGFYLGLKGTVDAKIMLINPSSVLHECGTILSAALTSNAWNDYTLLTPLHIHTGQAVRIFVGGSANYIKIYQVEDTGGFYDATHTYSTFCDAVPDVQGADWSTAVRIEVTPE